VRPEAVLVHRVGVPEPRAVVGLDVQRDEGSAIDAPGKPFELVVAVEKKRIRRRRRRSRPPRFGVGVGVGGLF
jgi:hypothetical protein